VHELNGYYYNCWKNNTTQVRLLQHGIANCCTSRLVAAEPLVGCTNTGIVVNLCVDSVLTKTVASDILGTHVLSS
jgi:hypothetical protein